MPPDIEFQSGSRLEHDQCLHRFLGKAQVADFNYQNPKMIPVHLIIFDEDSFGVIYFQLQAINIYKRIKKNLNTFMFDEI